MVLGTYIMAPELISTVYSIISPSVHVSVCISRDCCQDLYHIPKSAVLFPHREYHWFSPQQFLLQLLRSTYFPYFDKNKGRIYDIILLSACLHIQLLQLLEAIIVEPEETQFMMKGSRRLVLPRTSSNIPPVYELCYLIVSPLLVC
jgi:hypothetical protein